MAKAKATTKAKKATTKTKKATTKAKKATTKAKPKSKAKTTTKKTKPKIKIENIVASASVDAEIDLDKLAAALSNAEYEPEQFPGLVLRLEEPKTAILVFTSGKMVCTGAKTPKMIEEGIAETIRLIRKVGIKVKGKAKIDIQNIVASSDLNTELNLDKVAFSLPNAEFEPEQFPGLVFRVFDPKVVFLLFRSGKIVCTGAKKRVDLDRGVEKLIVELKKIKML